MPYTLISAHDGGGYDLHLAGFTVLQCCVDAGFTLLWAKPAQLTPDQQYGALRVDGPFDLTLDGSTFRCDPERDIRTVQPAILLYKRTVQGAHIDAQGTLVLTFVDNTTLTVPSNPTYESWTLSNWSRESSGGYLVVGGVGGEVHVFPPRNETGPAS
jgi:hypothetical protein